MMTLNERFLAEAQSQLGDDPMVTMIFTMFEGNFLSIPEVELREYMQKYLKLLQDLLLEQSKGNYPES